MVPTVSPLSSPCGPCKSRIDLEVSWEVVPGPGRQLWGQLSRTWARRLGGPRVDGEVRRAQAPRQDLGQHAPAGQAAACL